MNFSKFFVSIVLVSFSIKNFAMKEEFPPEENTKKERIKALTDHASFKKLLKDCRALLPVAARFGYTHDTIVGKIASIADTSCASLRGGGLSTEELDAAIIASYKNSARKVRKLTKQLQNKQLMPAEEDTLVVHMSSLSTSEEKLSEPAATKMGSAEELMMESLIKKFSAMEASDRKHKHDSSGFRRNVKRIKKDGSEEKS